MGFIELCLIAIGLAMDAFAVSLCRGLKMRKMDYKISFSVAFCFGFFQALMPFLGWALGVNFRSYISGYDHWVAFILLWVIGLHMIVEALKPEDEQDVGEKIGIKELLVMGIATSVDALAVGISFAVFPNVNIFYSCAVIGLITFIIAFIGVLIGRKFGVKYKEKAEVFGGIILVLIGVKILVEHLFF